MSYVGERVSRVDGADKVTGRALFGNDLRLSGMLHGAVLRSPHPHARIVAIDTTRARAAPGVRAVATGRDFPFTFGASIQDQPFLALDRARYVGEAVAAVAADTEAQAREARDLISVQYEELPAVLDPWAALAAGAPLVHPDLHTYRRGPHEIVPHTNVNTIARYAHGDVEGGLREADLVFEDEFIAHALSHAALEAHTAIARYDGGTGGYTLWVSTDRPFQMRSELAAALGLPSSRVRIIVGYVGGSFGGKNTLVAEAPAVALARFAGGRPVRVEYSREEDLIASQMRMPACIRLTTGVRRDGTLLARRAELLWDGGAYASNAVGIAIRGPKAVFGPYRIPHIEFVSRMVYTNKQITGSYRGYGTTQAAWACESEMDVIAHRLGLDPLAIRLQNGYAEGDPWHNGQILHGVNVAGTLERASAEIGWGTVDPAPAPHLRRGKGIATMIKETATPTSSNVVIKVEPDGQVSVLCAAPEIGAGQATVLAQMAADAVGVPLEAVSLPATDTATTPYNGPVASSRTTFHVGHAIGRAGLEVRRRALALAGESLGVDADRLDLRDGVVYEAGTRRITLREVLASFGAEGCSLVAEARYSSAGSPLLKAEPGAEWGSSIFHMIATQAVEIEVDLETGVVRVLRVAAAADVGRAVNPTACEQQIEGGVVMGLSNTLFEEFHWEGGRIRNDGFADYKLATIQDTPEIVPIIVESHHPEAPFGAKGIGEPAAAATAPAIANALFAAVGVRIRDLPITPEKVLAALRALRSGAVGVPRGD
ncbi:MAG: xanthine dehydrogenase family protein molybdopterin-binding subunit [Actinomycetota bacterium]